MGLPPPVVHRQRLKWVALFLGGFALIGLGIFLYWLFWWRFFASTNDAYVNGNLVMLTPQIPGIVTTIYADDTQMVDEGQLLVELDSTDSLIRLSRSGAQLGEALRIVAKMFDQVGVLTAKLARDKAMLIRAAQDYEHRKGLAPVGGVSREDFEHSIAALRASFAALVMTENQLLQAEAQVYNTTIATHPLVQKAKDVIREAWVHLQRCKILSPVRGMIAERSVQVGKQVAPGMPLLAVLPLEEIWVTANFKETALGSLRIGQSATVTADIYGSGVPFRGRVIGIGGGTGSVFSLLPPQNATGNWIKIVQRVPVRIGLEPEQVAEHPLRIGLSTEVRVDVRNTQLAPIPPVHPAKPLYGTDVYSHQEEGAEAMIERIISDTLERSHQL